MNKRCFRQGLVLVWPFMVHAQVPEAENSFPLRLQPYEPSYFIWRYATHDQNALAAHYSFRYLLNDPAETTSDCGYKFWSCKSEFYLSYTGDFDFYYSTRPSSPVVNRTNNPAIHWRWVYDLGTWVDAGLEHRSNGQVLDVSDPAVVEQSRQAYNHKDYAFLDRISRSANFVSVSAARRWKNISAATTHEVQVKAKWYLPGEESAVVWGPMATRTIRFSDYDRLRLIWRGWWNGKAEYSVEAVVGDRGLSTNSWNVDLTGYIFSSLAVYVRAHTGPFLNLSDYTSRRRSIGIGLKLVPYVDAFSNH